MRSPGVTDEGTVMSLNACFLSDGRPTLFQIEQVKPGLYIVGLRAQAWTNGPIMPILVRRCGTKSLSRVSSSRTPGLERAIAIFQDYDISGAPLDGAACHTRCVERFAAPVAVALDARQRRARVE